MTAATSFGLQARRRTRCGRVDFGASARFHRYIVRRLMPTWASASASSQSAARRRSKRSSVRYRSAAAGGTFSSTAMLWYGRTRMDSMFMVRASFSGFAFTGGYPIRRRGAGFPAFRRRSASHGRSVPNVSEPEHSGASCASCPTSGSQLLPTRRPLALSWSSSSVESMWDSMVSELSSRFLNRLVLS